jgi:hypothetical protein
VTHHLISPDEFESSLRHLLEHPDVKEVIAEMRRAGGSVRHLISSMKTVHNFRFELKNHPKCALLLSDLCKAGCSEERLTSLLLNASMAANAEPIRLLDTAGLSTAHLKALKRDVLRIASLVNRVNKTSSSPKFDLKWASPSAEHDSLRVIAERLYDMLPGMMQAYAVHLERFAEFNRKILRRLTLAQYRALQLLRYVHETTGNPRYQVAADLLAGAFSALAGANVEVPKFFSFDALTKLYQRTTDLDKKSPKVT